MPRLRGKVMRTQVGGKDRDYGGVLDLAAVRGEHGIGEAVAIGLLAHEYDRVRLRIKPRRCFLSFAFAVAPRESTIAH
jgi:hypothetical protein